MRGHSAPDPAEVGANVRRLLGWAPIPTPPPDPGEVIPPEVEDPAEVRRLLREISTK